MGITHRWVVSERSQVAEARRFAQALAQGMGFPEGESARVALVVTELATNLIKHSPKGGELIANVLEGERNGFEILSLDQGAGIANLGEALRDGFSSVGTSGTGLGAVRRNSGLFDIYSRPEAGSAILARFWADSGKPPPAAERGANELDIAAIKVAHPHEEVCGDAWARGKQGERELFLVADGLGHGLKAGEASAEAARTFQQYLHLPLEDLMQTIHEALGATRGAVVALAEIDRSSRRLSYVGVGNISGWLYDTNNPDPRHKQGLVSHNGTVGQEMRRIQTLHYPLPASGLLIMHSDGLNSRWSLERYPGLERKPAALIAGVLYRDAQRGRDDSAILVVRNGGMSA